MFIEYTALHVYIVPYVLDGEGTLHVQSRAYSTTANTLQQRKRKRDIEKENSNK